MATAERVRTAALACTVGGALWLVVLMGDVVAHGTIYDSATSYRVWEAVLVLVDVLLLAGVVGLAWSGAVGDCLLGRVGLGIALLGRVAFLAGEVHSVVQGRDDELLVPVGAVLTALGMLLAGIAVLRARRWDGWHRLTPLLIGVYPFVAMFPILALTGEPPALGIALWGIPWLLLGLAVRAEAAATVVARPSIPAPASA